MNANHARVALITGAARRVGKAIALQLATSGYDLAIHYRSSKTEAAQLGRQIAAMGRRHLLIQGDLIDPETPANLVQETVAGLGRLDVLINNAARFGSMTLEDFDLATWDEEIRVNLTAAAALTHHARLYLAEQGSGCVVNIGDISGDRPWSGHLAYCVSKAGLASLTKALARELAPNIRVNAVAPGIAAFPEDYDATTQERLIAKVPLARPGTPEDIASAVQFLLDDATYMTGQVLNVDGGRSIA